MGVKGAYFTLKLAKNGQGTEPSGGLKAAGQSHSLPETDGIRFFMMNPQGGAGLLGKEKFEGVGAEVEHGTAKRGIGHTLVKAVSFTDGKAFAESRRTGWE